MDTGNWFHQFSVERVGMVKNCGIAECRHTVGDKMFCEWALDFGRADTKKTTLTLAMSALKLFKDAQAKKTKKLYVLLYPSRDRKRSLALFWFLYLGQFKTNSTYGR
jgi:hypothetical protein